MDIRQLHEQGLSQRAIAHRLGIDRKTVRKALQQNAPPGRQTRDKPSMIDPHRAYLEARLRDYPELTTKRLHEELIEQGFTGGYTIVKDHVRTIRPKKDPIAVLRFETPPGHQAQVDWGEFGYVQVDQKQFKLYVFSIVLGYSRTRYIEYTLDIKTPTLIQCHLNAFAYFGGYPRELLYDNMQQVARNYHSDPARVNWNPTFTAFVRHFGIGPRLCRPYRAQTKGKTERLVGYVRTDFFEGRRFASLQDINHQSRAWLDKVNNQPHRETMVVPLQALPDEHLRTTGDLPEYIVTRVHYRTVTRDCYVHFEGNRYSVPWKNAHREAVLRVRENKLYVEVAGDVVAMHRIVQGNGRIVRDPRHFDGLLEALGVRSKRARPVMDWTPAHEVVTRPLLEYERLLDDFVEDAT